jgi:hypothetical protein
MCYNTHSGGSTKCMDQQQSYSSLEFLVQQTLAVVQIFVHPFSCNWFTFSCCSFDDNTIHKLYKKLATLGLTDADCCVYFCASIHLCFRCCCSSFGNNTIHKLYKRSIILGPKMLFKAYIFAHAFSCKWSRFHCGSFGNNTIHTLHKISIISPFCSSGL